mgnify:CR=1 FL=1
MLSRMLTRSQMALLCLGLFLALALCGAWQAFSWGRTQLDTGALVCADTLRLHIRAESDSIASQSAKLHVRDAVLAYLDTACPAQSKPEAIAWAAQHLFELQLTARHALAQLNIRTPVRVQLVNMYFDTRRYASGTLPAGRYDALRIDLGAGKGRQLVVRALPGPVPLCLRQLCPARRKRPCVRGVHPPAPAGGMGAAAHRPPGGCGACGVTPGVRRIACGERSV